MSTSFAVLKLTPTEERILDTIVRQQPLTATKLIEATGSHRKVVYDILLRFSEKALVTSVKSGKERLYSFGGAPAIRALQRAEEEEYRARQEAYETLQKAVARVQTQPAVETHTVQGKAGVRYAFELLLSLKADYNVIGAPKESEDIMGETYWLNFHQRQKELGIRVKAIFNPGTLDWQQKTGNPKIAIRQFEAIEPLAETIICQDCVITIVWTHMPNTHITRDAHYAKTQQSYFAMLWRTAKPARGES